jgi:hypothetical protein
MMEPAKDRTRNTSPNRYELLKLGIDVAHGFDLHGDGGSCCGLR